MKVPALEESSVPGKLLFMELKNVLGSGTGNRAFPDISPATKVP
jgi:hypothetical protein